MRRKDDKPPGRETDAIAAWMEVEVAGSPWEERGPGFLVIQSPGLALSHAFL